MKICVFGLWHLGTVTAACLASKDIHVIGLDPDRPVVEGLQKARAPLFEPGLNELLKEGIDRGNLKFTTEPGSALRDADWLWVTFDTPVDEKDRADMEFVVKKIEKIFAYFPKRLRVMISSQLSVGTTAKIEKSFIKKFPLKKAVFYHSPENLRLGKAIKVFFAQERVVIGARETAQFSAAEDLFGPFCKNFIKMSIESAEMTKHALNAFLAISITFMNEVAVLCERAGADAAQVEKGLRSDPRVGERAYVKPGPAFSGGTLARDVHFLENLSKAKKFPAHLLRAVSKSNEAHRAWIEDRLYGALKNLSGKKITLLGLTYKPGTDTLRGSPALLLASKLFSRGVSVWAYDPVVTAIPKKFLNKINLSRSAAEAARGSDALVIMTGWNDLKSLKEDQIVSLMKRPLVIDPNRFLAGSFEGDPRIHYVTVGRAA